MRGACFLLAAWLLVPNLAIAGNTTTLPAGAIVLDESWIQADTAVQWSNTRQAMSLLQGIDRYEPGGGLQGTIIAKPFVRYRFMATQIFYGITDTLTAAIGVPVVTSSTIAPHFGWIPGDYQSSLGRKYSEDDFWAWAKSMGQPKPGAFDGNHNTLADMVIGLRYRLPDFGFLQAAGVRAAVAAQIALPTGRQPDPEELVAAGTTVYDLNNYGDAELHLALDKPMLVDGIPRLNLAFDAWYAYLRPRTYVTPKGTRNPLLLTYAPYVGDTYVMDPGDFAAVMAQVEVAAVIGPTRASIVSGGSLEKAQTLPPLLQLAAGHAYVHVSQTRFLSESPVWNWDKEKVWMPGDKNTVRLQADVSLLRLGLPLQIYSYYRNQEWVPGKNTRASNTFACGIRLLMKFW